MRRGSASGGPQACSPPRPARRCWRWPPGRLCGGRIRRTPRYFDAALVLFLIPLLSPQGWDYVLLISTPAVLLLLDRLDALARPQQWLLLACLALGGLTFWDVLGREPYKALMMSRVVTVGALVQIALFLRLRFTHDA